MAEPIDSDWSSTVLSDTNLNKTTYGQGTSFPSTWRTDRIFWRTDENKIYQNTGTENSPTWTNLGGAGVAKKKFTTAGDTLTPETQTGLMEVMIDASSVTAGNITLTVDGTETVYGDGTASTTFWSEPTSSISIQARSEGYKATTPSASNVTGQETLTNATGITISADGNNMYVKGSGTNVYRRELSNPNDINSPTSTTDSFNLGSGAGRDIQISSDGTKFYYITNGGSGSTWYIQERHMSTAYDITTLGSVQNTHTLDSTYPYGLDITDNGINVTLTHSQDSSSINARVYHGTMSTAWDISTLTMTSYYSVPQNKGFKLRGVSMANDGSVYWYTDQYLNNTRRWEMSTPYDTSTGTQVGLFDTNYTSLGNEFLVTALETSSDGTVTWIAGTTRDRIVQFPTADTFAGTGYAKVL